MTTFRIAFRNLLRNRRRSAMTGLAVAVGTMTLLLFGAFQSFVFSGLETDAVRRGGHLAVFKRGYFLLGAGNPGAYGIGHSRELIEQISSDPEIAPLLNVVTPTLAVMGIAGNFEGESAASTTFAGIGRVPSDRERMWLWDEHGVGAGAREGLLEDADDRVGYVGVGLARVLGLCRELKLVDCPKGPLPAAAPVTSAAAIGGLPPPDPDDAQPGDQSRPHVELLAATAGGAPNVVRLDLGGAERQAAKQLDDSFVGMHLRLAQQLVFGRGEPKVTGIVLQLHHTRDLERVRARLQALFAERGLDLEVRDFGELNPFYLQVKRFFGAIFLFISLIMGIIVLFTVVNTMTMAVLERTGEIGTSRALGVRRSGIRFQFMVEGFLLGAAGAAVGVAVALAQAALVNRSGLTWTPPASSVATPFKLALANHPALFCGAFAIISAVATVAALLPANRAARLQVVDALRHT